MTKTKKQLVPYNEKLHSSLHFRLGKMPTEAVYPSHSHKGGEFVYSYSGIMELELESTNLLVTPNYGIWLPPNTEHSGLNRQAMVHGSLYVSSELCKALPKQTCTIVLNSLSRAILEHLKFHPMANDEEQQRLLRVLVDQLARSTPSGSYLPTSDDPLIASVIDILEKNPGDSRSLSEIARSIKSSERTLARRFQAKLGFTFLEWRQRLRVVYSISLLKEGLSVESISNELGYGSASAFIAMFHKLTGVTPTEYRKSGSPFYGS